MQRTFAPSRRARSSVASSLSPAPATRPARSGGNFAVQAEHARRPALNGRGDHLERDADRLAGRVLAAAPTPDWTGPLSDDAPLPGKLRGHFEPILGRDLSEVRVHIGPDSAATAAALQSAAFTSGNDIHFGTGQFRPGSPRGLRLLAHELAHVLQQGSRVDAPLIQRAPIPTEAAVAESERAVTDLVLSRYGPDFRDISPIDKNIRATGPDRVFVLGQGENAVLLHVDAKLSWQEGPVSMADVPSFLTEAGNQGAGLRRLLDNARDAGIINDLEHAVLVEDARMGLVLQEVAGFGSVSGISKPLRESGVTYAQGEQPTSILEVLERRRLQDVSRAARSAYSGFPKDPRNPKKTIKDVWADFEDYQKNRDAFRPTAEPHVTPEPTVAVERARPPARFAPYPTLSPTEGLESHGLPGPAPEPGLPRGGGLSGLAGKGLLAYGAYHTGQRLWDAWGTDEFGMVASQEVGMWALGFVNPAAAIGIGLGMMYADLMGQAVAAVPGMFAMIVEGASSAGSATRGISDLVFFEGRYELRTRLDPNNWDLGELPVDMIDPMDHFGLAFWKPLENASENDFPALAGRPLSDFDIPYPTTAPLVAALAKHGLLAGSVDNGAARQELLKKTPLELVQMLENARLLRHVRSPEIIAHEQIQGHHEESDPRTLERARLAGLERARLNPWNWTVNGRAAAGVTAFAFALWAKLQHAGIDDFLSLSTQSIGSFNFSADVTQKAVAGLTQALFPMLDAEAAAPYVLDMLLNWTPQDFTRTLIQQGYLGFRVDPAALAKDTVDAVRTGYQPW